MNGISLPDLNALNPGLNCFKLDAGRKICVPAYFVQPYQSPEPATTALSSAAAAAGSTTMLYEGCSCSYKIAPGDTCDIIAKVYKTTVAELYTLNMDLNCEYLEYGKEICVYGSSYAYASSKKQQQQQQHGKAKKCKQSYKVKQGDTCYTVSIKLKVDLNKLKAKYDCKNMHEGLTICL
jgi:LysM repeat protein